MVTVTLNGLKSPGAVQALTSKSRRRAALGKGAAVEDAPSAQPASPAAASARVVSEEDRQRLAEYRSLLTPQTPPAFCRPLSHALWRGRVTHPSCPPLALVSEHCRRKLEVASEISSANGSARDSRPPGVPSGSGGEGPSARHNEADRKRRPEGAANGGSGAGLEVKRARTSRAASSPDAGGYEASRQSGRAPFAEGDSRVRRAREPSPQHRQEMRRVSPPSDVRQGRGEMGKVSSDTGRSTRSRSPHALGRRPASPPGRSRGESWNRPEERRPYNGDAVERRNAVQGRSPTISYCLP